jgi:hypothetical protein
LSPWSAKAQEVDLQLVLAIDISRSIDEEEARLQREGYIAAFLSPQVHRAVASGRNGRIGVIYMEWAGTASKRVVIDWTLIDGPASAKAFADRLHVSDYMSASWTSISGAIDFAMALFDVSPFKGGRRVIDISGDGRNNQGRPAAEARDDAVRRGVTINGLPITTDRPNFGRPAERDLDLYYEKNVIGGPDAFLVVAEGFQAFGQAIVSKLIKEIALLEAPR